MRYPEILQIEGSGQATYDEADAMLYALALGFGADPCDERELPFVYEQGLKVVPTMNVLLATGAGPIIAQGGLDYRMIVHGEQRLIIHRPLPPAAEVRSRSRCLWVDDKGPDKGAVVDVETVVESLDGEPYSTQLLSLFCRGDGGQGGKDPRAPLPPMPEYPWSREVSVPTLPQQALIYRLTGDRNPLHADPAMARAFGFDRPILHGLASYGIACRIVLREFCDYDTTRIGALDVRFAGPLYPGETLTLRFWQEPGSDLRFEALAAERSAPVLSHGRCRLNPNGE